MKQVHVFLIFVTLGFTIACGGRPTEVLKGAETALSGAMLAKLGCTFVVVGHSERREHHNEDDGIVNGKAKTAQAHDLIPIVCVGEGLSVRQSGDHVDFVLNQVRGSLDGLGAEQVGGLVIAYEPVWAIGTGEVATGDDAQEVCGAIRLDIEQRLGASCAQSVRILYGGSVKAANVAGIMSQPDVDGCLVGGASLDADEFIGIVRYRLHPEMLA